MARRNRPALLPLELPQPFRPLTASFTTREELVDVLVLIDALHEATKPDDGTFVANAFAHELALCEPTARTLVEDFATAIAVGHGVHRITERDPKFEAGPDEMHPLTSHVLAWAAMEQAADAPERHGPWIAHATQLGYVVAKRGNGVLRMALAHVGAWREQCPPMTHSAYFEQRLVLDIGAHTDGSLVARNYLTNRPAGIEHAHDLLLFQTACDDFIERMHGTRVNGTTKLRNVFSFSWKTLT